MLDFRGAGLVAKIETVELIVALAGETPLAVRVGWGNRKRLGRLVLAQLHPASPGAHPALLGFDRVTGLPVFDLAQLLGLGSTILTQDLQVLIDEDNVHPAEFVIDQYQEVTRVNLNEVDVLPAIVEQNLVRPVVWALWRKSKTEVVFLIEPSACLSTEEWLQALQSS